MNAFLDFFELMNNLYDQVWGLGLGILGIFDQISGDVVHVLRVPGLCKVIFDTRVMTFSSRCERKLFANNIILLLT